MATDVDEAYQGWSPELSDGYDSHEIPASQILDHGSISFGRFPVETLSWERRSVFTHNRCQEELEKFNGLVAKKKAYFEERYRKIRAMKAEQNQQTELTLDYSGDGSISSQSGEEDAASTQHENFRDVKEFNVHSSSEEGKPGRAYQQEVSCSESFEEKCLCPESTLPNLISPIEILDSPEQDKNTVDTLLVQPLETALSLPHTTDLEEKSHFKSNLDNKEVLQKQWDKVLDLESKRQGTILNTSKANSDQWLPIGKSLDYKSISFIKDLVSGRNIKGETKVNVVQSSKGVRTSEKIATQTLIMAPTCRFNGNTRPNLVTSSKPPVKTHSTITTPGPFTLVMERRAIKRRSTEKLTSGGSNMHVSKPSHAKDSSSLQVTTKKDAATSRLIKQRGPEVKRDIKGVRGMPLAVDNHSNILKRAEAHVVLRSVNLPYRTKLTTCVGVDSQCQTAKGTKQKEGNDKGRKFQRIDAKTAPTMSGNVTATKKPFVTRETHSSHGGRNSRVDNLSVCDRKMRRSGTPQWR
ncbi:protein WVD2-like 7 isoform X2 [Zingiber officinale]|uniref:protein WVD2-like 7 isoform X2 n=1 Tax=Zingiber officinale TaxID=94328 RepID=UPI001C4DA7EB|nr:protein WVD2-like 7 isoform X2 [Zingiber officinale]